jgi:hypothetical protein
MRDMDWHFWRWFRRKASHSSTEGMPASVIRAEKRSARFSLAETCFGVLVVAGVLYEDWDNFPMIAHPNSPQGRMAIGGIIVAFGIVAEVWCSSRSSKAEHEVRDWYALRVAELDLARTEIEERMEPRRLSIEQQIEIGDTLRHFAGHPAIGVSSYGWDVESFGLSKQIVAALGSAGLAFTDRSGNNANTGVQEMGVKIIWWISEELGAAIADALTSIGQLKQVTLVHGSSIIIGPQGTQVPNPTPSIYIYVLPKPVPTIQNVELLRQ